MMVCKRRAVRDEPSVSAEAGRLHRVVVVVDSFVLVERTGVTARGEMEAIGLIHECDPTLQSR